MFTSSPITRRLAVSAAAALTAVGLGQRASFASSARSPIRGRGRLAQVTVEGPFTLPPLSYDFAALEPNIDARTMEIHHDKHHAAFINNLNTLVADGAEIGELSPAEIVSDLAAIPEGIRTAVRNNAGGHWNHTFFWEIMSPDGGGQPTGELADAIGGTFGFFTAFQDEMNAAAASRFGSGFAWLIVDEAGDLAITSTPNQDNPLMTGVVETVGTPVIGIDVWEHAYYLKYQNRRPEYLAAWWNTVNWEQANENFLAATG